MQAWVTEEFLTRCPPPQKEGQAEMRILPIKARPSEDWNSFLVAPEGGSR